MYTHSIHYLIFTCSLFLLVLIVLRRVSSVVHHIRSAPSVPNPAFLNRHNYAPRLGPESPKGTVELRIDVDTSKGTITHILLTYAYNQRRLSFGTAVFHCRHRGGQSHQDTHQHLENPQTSHQRGRLRLYRYSSASSVRTSCATNNSPPLLRVSLSHDHAIAVQPKHVCFFPSLPCLITMASNDKSDRIQIMKSPIVFGTRFFFSVEASMDI
ncbi:hypothetical protein B0T21DRAFT_65480 [Apiosordaria backusii]|uniref:Uncharacterized protein n=1 Tax=Apiosordaria backusii TaxID=314023 RepID=A0AA40DUC6_9PEZI|nr:hypothetical protein B0T21DRAFT_65480 [Apiosordaria backusii]